MEAEIRRALARRWRLKFRYHGHSRQVQPHALGRATGGRLAMLAWQTSGGSSSEAVPGWRTFVLDEIEALEVERKGFSPRPEYNPDTTQLAAIEAEVAKD